MKRKKYGEANMKKLIITLISLFLVSEVESGSAQTKIPQNIPAEIPKNIQSNDPLIIENVSVSNDINMQYTIRLKNNSLNPIPLSQLKIVISYCNQDRILWVPSFELLKPSTNTVISPGQTTEVIYRCTDDIKTVLKQLDNGILNYNLLNFI